MEWMKECGARIPETHGFCCLNVTSNTQVCAGLDLQPMLLGARGVELLIAALHRNDCGVPEPPQYSRRPQPPAHHNAPRPGGRRPDVEKQNRRISQLAKTTGTSAVGTV